MKKKMLSRAVDLSSSVPVASPRVIAYLSANIAECLTDYNAIMEMYEAGERPLEYLFMLLGNVDSGVFQHLPLFCQHYKIKQYAVVDKVLASQKEETPYLIGVKKDDPRAAVVAQMLGETGDPGA